jgi:hypothetical protein
MQQTATGRVDYAEAASFAKATNAARNHGKGSRYSALLARSATAISAALSGQHHPTEPREPAPHFRIVTGSADVKVVVTR